MGKAGLSPECQEGNMTAALKLALAAGLALLSFVNAGQAADTLFQIRSSTGGAAFAVTEEVIRKAGLHEYQAVLTATDGTPKRASGALLRDLIAAAGFKGSRVWATALDGYRMDLPMAEIMAVDVLAATALDGVPLSVRDRGPVWLVYPSVDHPEFRDPVHEARSVWQVKELVVE